MLTEKFMEVLKNEGVVSIVTSNDNIPHIVNTWNSYLVVTEDEHILIPAYAMRKTESNLQANPVFKMALGSRNVIGYNDYQGTGFVIEGTTNFLSSGEDYEMMKEKFSFLTRVLEVKVTSIKQML